MPDTPTFGSSPVAHGSVAAIPSLPADALPPLQSPVKTFNPQYEQPSPSTNESSPIKSPRRDNMMPRDNSVGIPVTARVNPSMPPREPEPACSVTVGRPVSDEPRQFTGAQTPGPNTGSMNYNLAPTPKPFTDPSHQRRSPNAPFPPMIRPTIPADENPFSQTYHNNLASSPKESMPQDILVSQSSPTKNTTPSNKAPSPGSRFPPPPSAVSGSMPCDESPNKTSYSFFPGVSAPQTEASSSKQCDESPNKSLYSFFPGVPAPPPVAGSPNKNEYPAYPGLIETKAKDQGAQPIPAQKQMDTEPLSNRSMGQESTPAIRIREKSWPVLFHREFPINLIKSRVLPLHEDTLLHESDDRKVQELRNLLESGQYEVPSGIVDQSFITSDRDRMMESRVRSFLLRFLRYHDMNMTLASASLRQTRRWLTQEGYAALSYNYISPHLNQCGIKLITSTNQRLPNRPRLSIITNAARFYSHQIIRLTTAYWLFRCHTDTSISLELDCAQTELETVRAIIADVFEVFELLALEPTDFIIANLTDGMQQVMTVPNSLFNDPDCPQLWHKFGIFARIDQLTRHAAVDYTNFPIEVSLNEKRPSLKVLSPLYDVGTQDESFKAIMQVSQALDIPINAYRAGRLNMDLVISYFDNLLDHVPGDLENESAPTEGSYTSMQTSALAAAAKRNFQKWLSEVIFQELAIPENICSNTTFSDSLGSQYVHVNGVWETYVFGKDKAGRVNICINDLTSANFQFISYLIIWIYRDLLHIPIGQSEQVNILINYYGVTLLNKRLTMLLDYLNLFYNSCINKIYIFNTTFINRTVLQTAIKGSKQGGSVPHNVGDAAKKMITVVIVTEDIRSDISSQQRQYQFGIGKHRVKMQSGQPDIPLAHFPARV